ncbi:hypothetical protein AAY473_028032 [Plecturocebus cupreus]
MELSREDVSDPLLPKMTSNPQGLRNLLRERKQWEQCPQLRFLSSQVVGLLAKGKGQQVRVGVRESGVPGGELILEKFTNRRGRREHGGICLPYSSPASGGRNATPRNRACELTQHQRALGRPSLLPHVQWEARGPKLSGAQHSPGHRPGSKSADTTSGTALATSASTVGARLTSSHAPRQTRDRAKKAAGTRSPRRGVWKPEGTHSLPIGRLNERAGWVNRDLETNQGCQGAQRLGTERSQRDKGKDSTEWVCLVTAAVGKDRCPFAGDEERGGD